MSSNQLSAPKNNTFTGSAVQAVAYDNCMQDGQKLFFYVKFQIGTIRVLGFFLPVSRSVCESLGR